MSRAICRDILSDPNAPIDMTCEVASVMAVGDGIMLQVGQQSIHCRNAAPLHDAIHSDSDARCRALRVIPQLRIAAGIEPRMTIEK